MPAPAPGDPHFPDYEAQWKKVKPATLIDKKLTPALKIVDNTIKEMWRKEMNYILTPDLNHAYQSLAHHVDKVLDVVRETQKKCNPKLHKDAIKHLDRVEAKLLSLLAMNKKRGEASNSLNDRIQKPLVESMRLAQNLTGRKSVAALRLDDVKEAANICARNAKAYAAETVELRKVGNFRESWQHRIDALVRVATLTGEMAKNMQKKAQTAPDDTKALAELDSRLENDFDALTGLVTEIRGKRHGYGMEGRGS